ncbi:hypothetical protein HAX54_021318, partial [Datura stramonium]|nr:hypothetical protein [Datura stramonium]
NEVEEEGMHYARIEEKNIWCNATPARQATRGSSKTCATRRATRNNNGAWPVARRTASLRVGRREALPPRRSGTCNAELVTPLWKERCDKGFQRPKIGLPLQLGKETLNPKSNSSRNKQSINLLL